MTKKYVQSLVSLFVFMILASVRQTPFVISLDNSFYILAMQMSYNHTWILFWEVVSFIGSGQVVYTVVGLSMLYFAYQNHNRKVWFYVLIMIACFLGNPLLKLFFAIDRPVSLSPYTELGTYTFPSGHSVNGVVLFYFYPRLLAHFIKERLPKIFLSRIFAFVGFAMVGASRIFLGAHWFSDVVGGCTFGFVIALLLIILLKKMSHDPSAQG